MKYFSRVIVWKMFSIRCSRDWKALKPCKYSCLHCDFFYCRIEIHWSLYPWLQCGAYRRSKESLLAADSPIGKMVLSPLLVRTGSPVLPGNDHSLPFPQSPSSNNPFWPELCSIRVYFTPCGRVTLTS